MIGLLLRLLFGSPKQNQYFGQKNQGDEMTIHCMLDGTSVGLLCKVDYAMPSGQARCMCGIKISTACG